MGGQSPTVRKQQHNVHCNSYSITVRNTSETEIRVTEDQE